jgi:hypothetical protein
MIEIKELSINYHLPVQIVYAASNVLQHVNSWAKSWLCLNSHT